MCHASQNCAPLSGITGIVTACRVSSWRSLGTTGCTVDWSHCRLFKERKKRGTQLGAGGPAEDIRSSSGWDEHLQQAGGVRKRRKEGF